MSFSENLMYNRESKIGKQVLAWALVFALTLSVIPYSSADGETEEWFEDWYYDFEDRDDKDIDNDGDTDDSDKYLHKRRKAVAKAMGETFQAKKNKPVRRLKDIGN